MKKLLSISLALLMLLSGMQLTISMHYCGGEFADSKVSLNGHIASCGMEGIVGNCTDSESSLDESCCKNQISVYAIDQNFSPTFTEFHTFAPNILQVFHIPASISFHSFTAINLTSTDASPPENVLVNAVSLPKICVFLI
ncbi:MAG TPA: hypothetical protein DHV48_05045 [Prolixibacteraceae bacterium]|nr:MAG: hypothetical protein A2066_15270 [Bacteroidetes bacterium GWB2_41_8]HCY40709.1 hypothetical protein [Prolixibacteraceae bacterium]